MFRYAVTTRTPFQSVQPRNWRPIKQTRSYILWKRRGRSPYRLPMDYRDHPGRILNCDSEFGRKRLAAAKGGFALVLPRPVTGHQSEWHGQPIESGQSGVMTLNVPRGTWDLSIQYASMPGLRVRAGRIDTVMPATIDRVGSYYLVGTIRQAQGGPLTIRATAQPMNAFARLLGAPGWTRALDSPGNLPLAGVALTRHHQQPKYVKAAAACGLYVDFLQPPQGSVPPRLQDAS
jgi:hypothetical protein